MRVKGINKAYYFRAEKTEKGVIVECGDMEMRCTALIISNEDWEKIKKEI